ncbi:MAG TPA: DUF6807 family protein, partial [Draconibacterium sp.]|nr:DUF6807 family protein [Draconibacterium sp.]
ALQNGPNIVWKYNFNTKHGKPFFHPVFVGNNNITCVSPDDHLWHLGQWFSWKFINGVNYWEYQNGTYQSEGITEIRDIQITQADNFSAEIQLDIVYHPIEGENVMVEKRQIKISEPIGNGNIYMDYKFEFEALADSVNIDRTPILGEPNGMSWGGYGGLSVRFNQDFMDSHFISVRDENDNINGMQGDWLYMGFTGLDGNKVGTQIIISPQSHREEAAWYIANTDELPFYYFSPAYLFNEKHLLLKGEKLKLNYRINHFAGSVKLSKLEDEFQKYEKNQNQ